MELKELVKNEKKKYKEPKIEIIIIDPKDIITGSNDLDPDFPDFNDLEEQI